MPNNIHLGKKKFKYCKYRSFEFSSLKLLILPFCHCTY